MKDLFETFYDKNGILMKSCAKRYWIGCRVAAITLLKIEAKAATGRTKVVIKRCITKLKKEL